MFDLFLEKVTAVKQWVHLQAGSGKTSKQPKETTEVAMTPAFILTLDDIKRGTKSLAAIRETQTYKDALQAGNITTDILDGVVQATINRTPLLEPETRDILAGASSDRPVRTLKLPSRKTVTK